MKAIVFASALGLAGCTAENVDVTLSFPSEETFLYSYRAQISIVEVDETELGTCPALLREVLAGTTPARLVLATSADSVCSYRNGGVIFRNIPAGPHAWIAVASNNANTPLLGGCTMSEFYDGAPEIEIDLFMTTSYRGATTEAPEWASVEEKCP